MIKKKKLVLINPGLLHGGYSNDSITTTPPLSLAYIAALTPKSWKIELLDENFQQAEFEPCDLVGITVMTPQAPRAYEIAEMFREKNVPVVMGGIHASMVQEEALQYADSVVVGEADNLWPDVIADFENNRLKKIYQKDERIEMAESVLPDHSIFDPRYRWGSVLVSRGCPFDCEFCSVAAFNGKKTRTRPVEDVVAELKTIKQKFIYFADDNIAGHSSKELENFIRLCKAMIQAKLNKRWFSQTGISIVDNDEALYYAKKSGCIGFFLGIESPDAKVLDGHMGKKVNLKYLSKDDVMGKIHSYGIGVVGSFIIGNDDDTLDTYDNIADYIDKKQIDIPNIGFLVPFPGTRLEKRLAEENRLPTRDFPREWSDYAVHSRAMFDTKNLTREQINFQMKQLALKVFSIKSILKRTTRALVLSRNIFLSVVALQANLAYRNALINSDFFKES